MKKILLDKNTTMEITAISNYFIDEYMPHASGEYVKIYLYLLRCYNSGIEISINSIADTFEHTEKDVLRALTYWEQVGIISLTFDSDRHIERITLKDVRSDVPLTFKYLPQKDDDTIIINTEDESSELVYDDTPVYTAKKIKEKTPLSTEKLKQLTADEDIKQLLYISQAYLGKTLSSSDTNTILYFYDGLHFSVELIEYLIEYCVESGHKKLSYIEAVAIDWAGDDISTVEEAKERTMVFSNAYYPVLKAFGISGRNPVAIEKAAIDTWTNDYGFSMDIITEACNRTIAAISKPSFKYADSILKKWKQHGISSIEDIKSLDKAHLKNVQADTASRQANKVKATTFNSFPQRNYDYSELERQLLHRD
jgi:DnaD/phage-associated family protein